MIIKKQPLPKAICCGCGDIQLLVRAALRNPTTPLIAVNWCMQYNHPYHQCQYKYQTL